MHTTEKSFVYLLWFLYFAKVFDSGCCLEHHSASYHNLLVMKELFDREVGLSCLTRSDG